MKIHLKTTIASLTIAATLCCSAPVSRKTNLLIITMDTTRADKLGTYGNTSVQTPHIDELARQGVQFMRAHSVVPLTLPSHATIMSGMYPPGHGIRNNGNYRLPEGVHTLAEVLSEARYHTAAIIGAFVLDSQFGLDQGFEYYHDSFLGSDRGIPTFGYAEREAGEVTELAFQWLEDARDPFFLWIHYFDPHQPYSPPPPYDETYGDDPYLGEIAYTDHCIGTVMKALNEQGKRENTLIVLTSDHGEALGEHMELSHGVFLYEETMWVPLIFMLDEKLPGGRKIEEYVSLADIFPTICDLLEVPAPEGVQGESLIHLIEGDTVQKTPIYMESMSPRETFGWSEITGVLLDGWKYLKAPEPELYNIENDPDEEDNLITEEHDLASTLDSLLDVSQERYSAANLNEAYAEMDEETRSKLESLGYIWHKKVPAEGDRPDPKRMIRYATMTEMASSLYNNGKTDEAIALFEDVLKQDPENIMAHNHLGVALNTRGDAEGAEMHWRRVIELNPNKMAPHKNLGFLLMENNRLEEAEMEFREALRLNPENVSILTGLGLTYVRMGKEVDAKEQFSKAIVSEPSFQQPYLFLGSLYEKMGFPDSALFYYRSSQALDTTSIEARLKLAKLLLKKGDTKEAIGHFEWVAGETGEASSYLELGFAYERIGMNKKALTAYERAVSIDPQSFQAHNSLGIMLLKTGSYREAEISLKRAISLNSNYAEPYFNLGNMYRELGKKERAIEAYRKFLKLWRGKETIREKALLNIESLERDQ